MKFSFLAFLFLVNFILAQDKGLLTDESIKGLVFTNEGNFLLLENGYLQLPDYDPYQEYYRMIYKDSTIVNPNLIINSEFSINIIPYLVHTIKSGKQFLFEEPLNLGLFIELRGSNNCVITDYGRSILDSLILSQ